MTNEHQKNFLQELQSLDEQTKRRVLLISSVVIMGIVIYLWLGYFNNIVNTAPLAAAQPSVSQSQGPSFWQDIQNGVGQMFASVGKIWGAHQYEIKPQ